MPGSVNALGEVLGHVVDLADFARQKAESAVDAAMAEADVYVPPVRRVMEALGFKAAPIAGDRVLSAEFFTLSNLKNVHPDFEHLPFSVERGRMWSFTSPVPLQKMTDISLVLARIKGALAKSGPKQKAALDVLRGADGIQLLQPTGEFIGSVMVADRGVKLKPKIKINFIDAPAFGRASLRGGTSESPVSAHVGSAMRASSDSGLAAPFPSLEASAEFYSRGTAEVVYLPVNPVRPDTVVQGNLAPKNSPLPFLRKRRLPAARAVRRRQATAFACRQREAAGRQRTIARQRMIAAMIRPMTTQAIFRARPSVWMGR